MDIDFTHQSYLELLAFLRGLGYAVGSFRDVREEQQFVLLRHDIDFSLERALEMARLDHEAGVTSTFFILLTSPYFNVLCEKGSALVRSIAELGHEIGLHIDLTGFEALDAEQQQGKINRLAAVLGDVAGCKITSIAQHRPASTLVRVHCPGFLDAYDDRYFKQIGYRSDSRRTFSKAEVYEFFPRHPRSQLLIHPIWWTATPMTRSQIFEEVGARLAAAIMAGFAAEDARIAARGQPAVQS